jgi:hypothetical protein
VTIDLQVEEPQEFEDRLNHERHSARLRVSRPNHRPHRKARAPNTSPSLRERKVDKFGRAYATGKRKNAVARVWVKPGKGQITINGKTSDAYFARPVLRMMINQPFKVTEREGEFDVSARSSVRASRAKPALCVTASRRRWPITSRRCVRPEARWLHDPR